MTVLLEEPERFDTDTIQEDKVAAKTLAETHLVD